MSDGSVEQQGFEISYTAIQQCGSDELACLSTGQCHPQDAWCNGELDCQDGSDEGYIQCG